MMFSTPSRTIRLSYFGRASRPARLAPFCYVVSTPSHGGIWIDRHHEQQIPASLRAWARQYAPAGWYEEDCDAAIPLLVLRDQLYPHMTPEEYERICGECSVLGNGIKFLAIIQAAGFDAKQANPERN